MPSGVYKWTPEHLKKIVDRNKLGHSEEIRKRISEGCKGRINYWEGKKLPEEMKRKMSIAHIGKSLGEKSNFWRGGVFKNLYPNNFTKTLRQSIRERDNYICQLCGINQDELVGRFKNLDIHHIDYNKDNLDLTNLVSLCRSCHIKTNTNREYWTKKFLKLLNWA